MNFLKNLFLVLVFLLATGGGVEAHEMQHGFVLADADRFASHLVAQGHHSRQTEILIELTIADPAERATYEQRKALNSSNESYFLFQAQQVDLPNLSEGRILHGHIIESKVGDYQPKNVIVKSARLRVKKILLNLPNPFFMEQ